MSSEELLDALLRKAKDGAGQQQQKQPNQPKQGQGQQGQGQQKGRQSAPPKPGKKRVTLVIWFTEVLWVFLTLSLFVQPTELSPEWWASPVSLGSLSLGQVWVWITLLMSVLIQVVFVYIPILTAKNYNYYYARLAVVSANRAVNFTGLYAAVEMLGFVPGLQSIRLRIAESLTVSDLLVLSIVGVIAWWTVTVSEMVSDSEGK